MSPIGTLWGSNKQRQTSIINSVASITGIELDFPEITFGETNKSPEFLAKFPLGKIPAFEGADGLKLTEGIVIAQYIASLAPDSVLQGKDRAETAQIDQWIHFTESELQVSSDFSWFLASGTLPGEYHKELHEWLLKRQYQSFECLENHLASHGYLVGDRLTIADISLTATLRSAVSVTLGASERAKYPKTMAHFDKIRSHEKVKDIINHW
ncbi:glutathione S-transferase C-terminal-like protein [Coniophora puteana RWD-64-598 SS2]|uniref:Glutathione S-transferase C-terminal-like protein n=1 Tax=Coniophora puteana (strain RWD-64-598) TaxID=741705 RepID=A0A5M3MWF0_CONPW|nr:glutathione S-transferase C-terminal-like protein [Coniophora puteana RWD-64-598 SS2]EIW83478.1 glutathione S-transferase C-terminal-like protein [Coniophora puteana RWD-64-598 SS2]